MKKYTEFTKDIWFGQFDDARREEIELGVQNGVDALLYADLKYDQWQMYEIRMGLQAGLPVEIYCAAEQLQKIRYILESGEELCDCCCYNF